MERLYAIKGIWSVILTAYSTLIRQQFMIDGETAGILSSCASQLAVRRAWMASPVTIVNLNLRDRDFPVARNVCVW